MQVQGSTDFLGAVGVRSALSRGVAALAGAPQSWVTVVVGQNIGANGLFRRLATVNVVANFVIAPETGLLPEHAASLQLAGDNLNSVSMADARTGMQEAIDAVITGDSYTVQSVTNILTTAQEAYAARFQNCPDPSPAALMIRMEQVGMLQLGAELLSCYDMVAESGSIIQLYHRDAQCVLFFPSVVPPAHDEIYDIDECGGLTAVHRGDWEDVSNFLILPEWEHEFHAYMSRACGATVAVGYGYGAGHAHIFSACANNAQDVFHFPFTTLINGEMRPPVEVDMRGVTIDEVFTLGL